MNADQLTEGQDSFLDIIANLVGVLIILVVVVGAQATSAIVTSSESKPTAAVAAADSVEDPVNLAGQAKPRLSSAESAALDAELAQQANQIDEMQTELAKTRSLAAKMLFDNELLEQQIDSEKLLASGLINQRHAMLTKMSLVREAMEQKKAELDSDQQKTLELQSEQIRLTSELTSITKETNAVSATQIVTEVDTIDHYPNPIAKTVFTNEVHFRLDGDKIMYVPMDELITEMKSEIRLKAEKLKQASVTRETVGPIEGFRLQYELGLVAPGRGEDPRARIVQFKRFVVQPVSFSAGEPIELALQDGSQFAQILSRHEPRRTTVSIWVYPNSYDSHSTLKKWLHERGFQMASWPLSEGRPISGGPSGFRTSAQ